MLNGLNGLLRREPAAYMNPQRYVIVDVETTGLAPHRGDRVIEVGAVLLEAGGAADEFHSLIRIKERIPVSAQLVHGISNGMLKDWPEADDVLPRFKKFIGRSILVAHNAQFDMRFLRYEFLRVGFELKNRYVCTLEMSRARFPRLPNHKLETVYRHVTGKRPDEQCHRALADARMVAEIWREIGR